MKTTQNRLKELERFYGKNKLLDILEISDRHYQRIAKGWKAKGTWPLAKLIAIYHSQLNL